MPYFVYFSLAIMQKLQEQSHQKNQTHRVKRKGLCAREKIYNISCSFLFLNDAHNG